MKRIKPALYLMAVLLLISFMACNRETVHHAPIFPLEKGNYWNYSGQFNDQTVNMRMEVKQVLKRDNLTFALMTGFPTDVMEGVDWEASVWGMLDVGSEHYYKVSGARIDTIARSLSEKDAVQSGLVTDSDLFIETLSDTGQTYGETAQLTRNDGNYFWRVGEKTAYDPSSIRGLKLTGPFDRFILSYKTVADETILDVVPGIGIVRYRYSHHGTPAVLDINLVEVRIQ